MKCGIPTYPISTITASFDSAGTGFPKINMS